jgi:hypothetical protein
VNNPRGRAHDTIPGKTHIIITQKNNRPEMETAMLRAAGTAVIAGNGWQIIM